MTTDAPILTLARIRRYKPCERDMQIVANAYPDGVPMTAEAGKALRASGVDVLWLALRLLKPQGRRDFILFTLRQRQPHTVSLFRKAGDDATADAIAALRFDTWRDAKAATPVLEAARASAWTSASASASASAWTSAWASAWDSARGSAKGSARDSAWTSARGSARDSAWASARGSARDSAWDEQIEWVAARLTQERAEATNV